MTANIVDSRNKAKYLYEAGAADAFSSAVSSRVRLIISQRFGVVHLENIRYTKANKKVGQEGFKLERTVHNSGTPATRTT